MGFPNHSLTQHLLCIPGVFASYAMRRNSRGYLPNIGRVDASARRQACETSSRPISGGCPYAPLPPRAESNKSDAHARASATHNELSGAYYALLVARMTNTPTIDRIRTQTQLSLSAVGGAAVVCADSGDVEEALLCVLGQDDETARSFKTDDNPEGCLANSRNPLSRWGSPRPLIVLPTLLRDSQLPVKSHTRARHSMTPARLAVHKNGSTAYL